MGVGVMVLGVGCVGWIPAFAGMTEGVGGEVGMVVVPSFCEGRWASRYISRSKASEIVSKPYAL